MKALESIRVGVDSVLITLLCLKAFVPTYLDGNKTNRRVCRWGNQKIGGI